MHWFSVFCLFPIQICVTTRIALKRSISGWDILFWDRCASTSPAGADCNVGGPRHHFISCHQLVADSYRAFAHSGCLKMPAEVAKEMFLGDWCLPTCCRQSLNFLCRGPMLHIIRHHNRAIFSCVPEIWHGLGWYGAILTASPLSHIATNVVGQWQHHSIDNTMETDSFQHRHQKVAPAV